MSARCAQAVLFRRYALGGGVAPPALRSACGGSHCGARSRLGRLAPVRPGGAPHKQGCHLASVDVQ
jgi:hypothetical protein